MLGLVMYWVKEGQTAGTEQLLTFNSQLRNNHAVNMLLRLI